MSRTEIMLVMFIFCDLFSHRIAIAINIGLLLMKNMKFRLTIHLKLVSFKNIDIWLNYGPKTIKFIAHAHIWACGFLPIISPNLNETSYTCLGDHLLKGEHPQSWSRT